MCISGAKRIGLHATVPLSYPEAKSLPLPRNVAAIMGVEIGQFSPQRARDITGPVLWATGRNPRIDTVADACLERYDCRGAVNLNASMQSNVPCPFEARGSAMYMHLNMPGGQWEQGSKLLAEDMRRNHYVNNSSRTGTRQQVRLCHTKSVDTLSRKERLKRAVKEYGSTVVVFHVGISLVSLGACYTLVSR